MSPLIYLGPNQVMCEHGLGDDVRDSQGAWAGTFNAGAGVGLFSHTPVIKNPNGAPVHGHTTLTCYSNTGFSWVAGATWVDGVYQQSWGHLLYGQLSYHTRHTFSWWTGTLAPGQHTVQTGILVGAGTTTFDSNDGGTSCCWEHP
jgi:hypothetical protein